MTIAALLVQTRVWGYGSLRNFFGRLFRTTNRKRCSAEDLCVETRHLPRLHTTIYAFGASGAAKRAPGRLDAAASFTRHVRIFACGSLSTLHRRPVARNAHIPLYFVFALRHLFSFLIRDPSSMPNAT